MDSGGMAGENAGGSPASAGSAQVHTAGASSGTGNSGSGGQPSNGGGGALAGIGGSASAGASGGSAAGSGGARAGNGGASGSGGGSACPGAGNITYTLAKSASPTPTEQAAYDKITTAMDKAISYYNCYTSITKSLKVSYVPSVATADGNSNGSMRFGMNTTYMDYRTAMHEIGHTVGIGQAANWGTFLSGGLFTGAHAAAQLKAINAKLATPLYPDVHADTQHFWPYGINQQSEVKGEADLIAHCQMVVAIRQDLGL
ncbi:MAG TPA: hypothetical protein VJV79_22270 [Polyangiaceae bacterium]|nr:hypothetical protein [Polyangiaceae bacterium]